MIYILIAAFSFWFVNVTKLPKNFAEWLKVKKVWYNIYEEKGVEYLYAKRLKPFDCDICLSFWLTLALTYSTDYVNWVLMAGVTSLFTFILHGVINRFVR